MATVQVVGWYLRLGGDRDLMRTLLVDVIGCHASSVDKMRNGTCYMY